MILATFSKIWELLFSKELELVIAVDRPSVVAAGAEFGSKFAGAAVEGVDEFGGDFFDGFEEARKVGVVGERKEGVDAVAVLRSGSESPSSEHGGAFGLEIFDEGSFAEVGRCDDDGAWGNGLTEESGLGEIDAGFADGLGHFVYRLVENDGELGAGEDGVDLLGFAERISIENGCLAEFESFLGEGENVGVDLFGGWEDEVREAEGRFHGKDVGMREDGGFGGEGIARFEITGVEEGFAIVSDADHGGAGDVPGGEELDVVSIDGDLILPIEEKESVFGHGVAFTEDVSGGDRAEDLFVSGEVVGVPVGDEGERAGAVGIEFHSQLWECEGTGMEGERHVRRAYPQISQMHTDLLGDAARTKVTKGHAIQAP